MGNELSKYELSGADYLIKIKSKKISLLDMSKMDYFYKLGYRKARKFILKNKNIIFSESQYTTL